MVRLVAIIFQVATAFITPEYHSLTWKFEEGNFWAPLGLNSSAYALESPAGAAPEALNRRGKDEPSSTQYLPCTVVTLEETLSGESLSEMLDSYRTVGDDVWSDAQV